MLGIVYNKKFFFQCLACMLSYSQLFVTPWIVACQAPLSMGFPRQEYWSGFPSPSPGDLPNPGIKPALLTSPALADGLFTLVPSYCECFQTFRQFEKNCAVNTHVSTAQTLQGAFFLYLPYYISVHLVKKKVFKILI